jgi:two-component system sensor histidine kinase/response regulator
MRIMHIGILLLLSAVLLEAAYLRSIRVGSFETKQDAYIAHTDLVNYLGKYPQIDTLQREHQFEIKYRRSGKYYITLVEPFYERKVLQKVLDTLRIGYKDVYVTRLKPSQVQPKKLQQDAIPEIDSLSPKKEIQKIKLPQPEVSVEQNISHKPQKVQQQLQLEAEKIKKEKIKLEQGQPAIKHLNNHNRSDVIYKILFFVSLLFFAGVLFLYFRQKRVYEEQENQAMILAEKYQKVQQLIGEKEKLVSHVSHELRTPLTSIMGLTHLALEDNPSAQQSDYLLRIEGSANHLLNIINDILDVSKIEAGALKLEHIEFDLNDVLEYVLNVVSVQAKKNENRVLLSVEKDVSVKLLGDPLRLGQIILNLVGNAVKFTSKGEVGIYVKQVSHYNDNITLEFIIKDNGIGMSKKQLEVIFSSFSQADDSVSRKYGGTGLGLSISKQLIEIMHGDIKVQSQEGKGTQFSVTLPFVKKDQNDLRKYRLPSKKYLNKKILIVHPIDKNILMLIKALEYFNYQTYKIPSFEEATLLEDGHYDIVVIAKEYMTEYAIGTLHKLQKQNNTKVVLLHERLSISSAKKIESVDIDGYLKLPFTQLGVLELLIELYSSKKKQRVSHSYTHKDKLNAMKGKKILVAEDNKLNHKVIQGLLADSQMKLSFVFDGKGVLKALKHDQYDLILMDLSMPNMDGFEATQILRKNPATRSIPVLALSADVMEQTLTRVVEVGMQGHIAKPIVVDIFYKKIYDVLQKSALPQVEKEVQQEKRDSLYESLTISVGLEKHNQSESFYRWVLKDFKLMYTNSSASLAKLCQEGDFKGARELAKSIKEASLNIGAYNLCEAAATMEYEFEKGSRGNWNKLLQFYEGELQKLFEEIEKYVHKK